MSDHQTESEYFEHAAAATNLLKRSAAVHLNEQAGFISHDEAVNLVVGLNERAASEIQQALTALAALHGFPNPDPSK